MKKFKIIVDSSSDLYTDYIVDDEIDFSIVPLSINIGETIFLDDDKVDVDEMLDVMNSYEGRSTTSCPAPGVYLEALTGAENYFVITLSSKLSGSFNSALSAITMSEEKNIHLIDSKLVSGAMKMIVDEIVRLIKLGKNYGEIVLAIDEYCEDRNILFTLNKYDNLVKAGRMSKLMSVIASTLRIVPVCEGLNGEIHIREKTITQKSAYRKIVEGIKAKVKDWTNSICVISHCFNEEGAKVIKTMLQEKCSFKEIHILPVKALCAFYALKGGIIVSF